MKDKVSVATTQSFRSRRLAKRKIYFAEGDVCIIQWFTILAAVSSLCGVIIASQVYATLLESTVTTRTVVGDKNGLTSLEITQDSFSSSRSNNTSSSSYAGAGSGNIPEPRAKSFKQILSSFNEEDEPYHENPDLLPYNPKKAPILEGWWQFKQGPVTPPTNFRPVRVRILMFEHVNQSTPRGEVYLEIKNIVMDGFQKSPYFDFVGASFIPDFHVQPEFFLREEEDVIWVVEERRRVYNVSYTIPSQLHYLIEATRAWQRELRVRQNQTIEKLPRLRVVLMDYRDAYYKVTCTEKLHEVIKMIGGPSNVRSVRNMLVDGRRWDPNLNFVTQGELKVSGSDRSCLLHKRQPSMHLAYTVRTDLAEAVEKAYPSFLPSAPNNTDYDSDFPSPCDTERTIDVAHFWPLDKSGTSSLLRHKVTETVLSLKNNSLLIDEESHERNIRAIGEFVSLAGEEGRSHALPGYVNALLTTKIIVCAQRDEWEDHYRLFESLTGGSLVMTDPMWQLPDGIVDGQHVIVYHSLNDLREKIIFYLQHPMERHRIACSGWRESMLRHRSYHEMERIFFGQKLSPAYL